MNTNFKNLPLVSLALIAINVFIWLSNLWGATYFYNWYFSPELFAILPQNSISYGFVHDNTAIWHLLLNMYSLYLFGSMLEPIIGRLRFLALWFVSIFGGAVAVMYLDVPGSIVIGASGGVFGLMAAYFVMLRSIGGNSGGVIALVAINFGIGFLMPNISWQGHLGGALAGGAVAAVYAGTRGFNRQKAIPLQLIGVVAVVAIFVALALYRSNIIWS